MWRPLIRCSIIGGVLVYLWLMLSWTVLPFHKTSMNGFEEEVNGDVNVEQTILEAAPKDGIYVIPYMDDQSKQPVGMGPRSFIFVNVKRGVDFSDMTQSIAIGMLTQVVGAFFITYLLLCARLRNYWGRVVFVTIFGLTIAILSAIPAWNWWHFPTSWVVLNFVDYVVGWFFGGIVIAKLAKD